MTYYQGYKTPIKRSGLSSRTCRNEFTLAYYNVNSPPPPRIHRRRSGVINSPLCFCVHCGLNRALTASSASNDRAIIKRAKLRDGTSQRKRQMFDSSTSSCRQSKADPAILSSIPSSHVRRRAIRILETGDLDNDVNVTINLCNDNIHG